MPLVKSAKPSTKPKPVVNPDSDILWGAEQIGAAINRKPTQVYHLHNTGRLVGAVRNIKGPGKKGSLLVGFRSKLMNVLGGGE